MQSSRRMPDDDTELQREILRFWFVGRLRNDNSVAGMGELKELYKQRWFPEANSNQQQRIDSEIFTSFGEVFSNALTGQLHHWAEADDIDSRLALLVLLDQFSRHIIRHKRRNLSLECLLLEEQQVAADSMAVPIALHLHESGDWCTKSIELPMPQFVFSLMPLRHSANHAEGSERTSAVIHLELVLKRMREKELHDAQSAAESTELLVHRFRKQTYRRLQHLQDRVKLEATDAILEHLPFKANESDIGHHPLVRTTKSFLEKYVAEEQCRINRTHGKSEEMGSLACTLIISLSGGVDSMVLAKILYYLSRNRGGNGRGKHFHGLEIRRIVAVHIDYANRSESEREAEYVRVYCEKEKFGYSSETEDTPAAEIICKVRRVDEVTRGVTNRDEYERVAREIRYDFYRQCISEELDSVDVRKSSSVISGVIFGHHIGDVQENVVSNVMRGSGPLHLSGMTEHSVTNGVIVWRPLLQHTKKEIFEFAHRYGVPYFKDSTPSWSTRGKLRQQLLPLLEDMYGTGCFQNLSALARESDLSRGLIQKNLYEPFLRSIFRCPTGIAVDIVPWRWQPHCFWREALKQMMHSMGMSMVRDKAVGNFVERIQRTGRIGTGWLELRKGFHSLLTESAPRHLLREQNFLMTRQGTKVFLVVLRDGVLRRSLEIYSSTTLNQLHQKQKIANKVVVDDESATAFTSNVIRSPSEVTQHLDIDQNFTSIKLVLAGKNTAQPRDEDIADSSIALEQCIPSLQNKEVKQHCEWNVSILHEPPAFSDIGIGGKRLLLHLQVGPWNVSIHLMTDNEEINPTQCNSACGLVQQTNFLPELSDILPGKFSYCIDYKNEPTTRKSENKSNITPGSNSDQGYQGDKGTAANDIVLCFAHDYLSEFSNPLASASQKQGIIESLSRDLGFNLKTVEPRLREGLPLLVPARLHSGSRQQETSVEHDGCDERKERLSVRLQLNYSFAAPS